MPIEVAPDAFPDVPAPFVSKNYVHINTNEFIRAMAEEGFQVAMIQKDNPISRDPRFVRHMVRFEHADHIAQPVLNEVRPQILFTNSHNRRTRATVRMGMFRFVCLNGLVIGDAIETLSVQHSGDAAKTLIARAADLARNTAPLWDQIHRWSKKELSPSQAIDFAKTAAALRFGEDKVQAYDPVQILAPRRAEDDGMTLWRVFNRVQESLTKGGVSGVTAAGRTITSRPLTELNYNQRFNAALWNAAAALE